ncbi:hypothetical protein M2451_002053 [Dysgonomonas sp. PFB1-18]|nr:hypothetical protein [Dysgonomonas sp. PF1-14]MDH6339229.1 hypothetical protein [Dysgonomonas sp. PF1-16]MDH6380728.1 hypothetical protein [Dysgonomonas sp. PFB1-18]MDH6398224.1 hypothetical protein [Dysgonomonas sp. PF1-23]
MLKNEVSLDKRREETLTFGQSNSTKSNEKEKRWNPLLSLHFS